MSRSDLRWYCGECGWPRRDEHTCPREPGEVIGSLVDALPRNTPSPAVLAEIEDARRLVREQRADAVQVNRAALQWLLTGFSYLEVATEKLASHRAVIEAAQAPKAAPVATPAPPATGCVFCEAAGGGPCAECYGGEG